MPSVDGSLELSRVEVHYAVRRPARRPAGPAAGASDTMVVAGRSGASKTTLLRSIAQMWPHNRERVRRPLDGHETMFLSQMPYVPLGDLRTVVSYPAISGKSPTRTYSGCCPRLLYRT